MSATQAAKKFTSSYRQAGLNYLDVLSTASTALRKVLKEPQRSEALARSNFKYREFTYSEGKESAPCMYDLAHLLASVSSRAAS